MTPGETQAGLNRYAGQKIDVPKTSQSLLQGKRSGMQPRLSKLSVNIKFIKSVSY